MRKIYLLVVLCLLGFAGFAQTAASYSFSRTLGTFTSIIGGAGTVALTGSTISSDDSAVTNIPIGFTFSYCGANYTVLSANANGYLSLVNDSLSAEPDYINLDTSISYISNGVGLIMAFWKDLYGSAKTAYYQTSGTVGSRVFTFEYADWSVCCSSGAASMNIQVRLYEGTNIVEFDYGTSAGSVPTSATIGICNGLTDYQTLPVETSTSSNTTFNSTCTFPANGTVLTFCPPPAAIGGNVPVCVAQTITLTETVTGGNWSSADNGIATVNASTGVVTGVADGIVDITYTTYCGGYIITSVTVNPLPASIVGYNHVCIGSTLTLTDATPGGAWSSSTGVVTVSSGTVTGVSVGTSNIIYTLTATGCSTSFPVTVNPFPTVSGGSNVTICLGDATGLTASGADTFSWSPAAGLSCANCRNPIASPTVTTTYTVTGKTLLPIVYSEMFYNGVTPTTQSTNWDLYRASLVGTINYTGFRIRGSRNTTGISCTDPVIANAVANALRTGTAYAGVSDGETWLVGIGCGPSGSVELSNQGSCTCANGYTIRPNIGNYNWGCIDGYTCSAPDQTMEVIFYTDGCSNTSTVTVSVNPLPNVYNVTGGGSYCAGGAGVAIGLDSSNAGVRYQLYMGATPMSALLNGTNAPISFGMDTIAGTYTAVATDTTTGCMSNMAGSANVTIIPVVVPTVSIFRSTSDTICQGTHTAFSAVTSDGGSHPHFMWKVNGVLSGPDSIIYDYPPATGVNRVNVVMISNAVCAIPDTVTSDTLTVVAFANGDPIVNLSASPSDTICDGRTVTITATPTYGGYGPTYIFIKNTVVVGSSSSYTYTAVDGDNIYAVMTGNYRCPISTNTAYSNVITMTVEPQVVPSVAITGRPGILIGPSTPDTLTATVTNGGTSPSYQWYLNGTIIAGATSNTFIRSSFNNKDSVSCMVTRHDACGFSTINSVVIGVHGVGTQILTKNGDVQLVPNPNKGSFSLKGNLGVVADEEVTVEVLNMIGQSVYMNTFKTSNGNIDASIETDKTLANGMYLLNLRSSKGNNTFHFVMEK